MKQRVLPLQISVPEKEVMAQCLKSMGFKGHEANVDHGILIDFLIPSQNLAIQFDSVASYFRNKEEKPMGGTIFRRRLTRDMGFKVISFSMKEWRALQKPEQKKLMQKKVAEALGINVQEKVKRSKTAKKDIFGKLNQNVSY